MSVWGKGKTTSRVFEVLIHLASVAGKHDTIFLHGVNNLVDWRSEKIQQYSKHTHFFFVNIDLIFIYFSASL